MFCEFPIKVELPDKIQEAQLNLSSGQYDQNITWDMLLLKNILLF